MALPGKSSRSRRAASLRFPRIVAPYRPVNVAVATAVVLGVLAGAVGSARADGAFPDSMSIFVPAEQPHQIVLATNFGLILSQDDGATWEWTCEPNPNDTAFLYQMGAAPSRRLFAVLVAQGLVYSDDLACSWSYAGGALAGAVTSDAFPDPSSVSRVFAVAAARTDGDALTPASVRRSDDGGSSFGPALYTAPVGGGILGVESALPDPSVVYVAAYGPVAGDPAALDPILARSSDGGDHFVSADLASVLGAHSFRIIAVDRADPRRLFLRVGAAIGETLAVSSDGGATFQTPVTVDDKLTSFVRLASGTVLVGGNTAAGPVGFRSADGGLTFQPWAGPPHLRAMAERAGKLFVAAENFLDRYAVAVSSDEGLTFQPLLTYDKVKRIKPCVQEVCRDVCDNLAGLTLWPPDVCAAPAPTRAAKGCGCRTARAPGDDGGAAPSAVGLVTLALGLLAARRRRRPASGRRRWLIVPPAARPAGRRTASR